MEIRWKANRGENGKPHTGILAMDIVIAALCLGLLFSAWFAVTSFGEVREESYRESTFLYRMTSQNYGAMVNMANTNRAEGRGKSEDFQEYYAVADYYRAALYYSIYDNAGDEARAERWKGEMEDAAGRLGTLSAEKQKIDAMLAR